MYFTLSTWSHIKLRTEDTSENKKLCSFVVLYGQAAHSPDHERHLTFRSQRTQETFGQNHSLVLSGGCALRDLREHRLERFI